MQPVRASVPVDEPLEVPERGGVWYVTFGQRYRRERHPSFPVAHPDGYLVVMGRGLVLDEEAARTAVLYLCGTGWCMIYGSLADLSPHLYPMGPLATLTVLRDGRVQLAFGRYQYLLPATVGGVRVEVAP